MLKRIREEFEPRGFGAFAYFDDISIGMSEITPDTVRVVPFLQHDLCEIGIAKNPSKTVALPPKGHVPTPEEIALLGGIGLRIAEGWGVNVVGVPIGSDAFAMNNALKIVRDGRATRARPSADAGQTVGEPHRH